MPIRDLLPLVQQAIMKETTYFGIQAYKSPTDAWIYQEIVSKIRPDIIIEIGNRFGGGTLHLAHLCDLVGNGKVIGVDVSHRDLSPTVRAHPRVTLLEGPAVDMFESVKALCAEAARVLVIEDSSHTFDNTLNVLRKYSTLLSVGDYFIVEDTICHHGLDVGPNPGPYEAVAAFLLENAEFVADRSKERFVVTWNPNGYLVKVA